MTRGLFIIVAIILSLTLDINSRVVSGVKRVSISFQKSGWFQPSRTKFALQDVTVDFAEGITAFCGSSGSGKSTLAKIIYGEYAREVYEGDIITDVLESEPQKLPTVYLDPFCYLTYDSTKSVGHYLKSEIMQQDRSILLEKLLTFFDLPEEKVINSLLESQKKFFEILLLFSRLKYNQNNNQNNHRGLLILDEYLDKDMTSVRTTFFKSMRELCNSKDVIDFQVIIVSHSKSVCDSCDKVIALKNGFVYSSGAPASVMKYLPPDFVLLD